MDIVDTAMKPVVSRMTDFEFLTHPAEPRRHFLYASTPGSGFLRASVRQHVTACAGRAGWIPMTAFAGETLHGVLGAPSFLDDRFYACDGSDFELDDLDSVMTGIANDAFECHLFLMISSRSKLLERASWHEACGRVGVIEEPTVTMENYRGLTRRLLEMSDLSDVLGFGNDSTFLARMKVFVQHGRGRSPYELAAEIDRIILTETEGGVVRPVRQEQGDARGDGQLGVLLAQFLDDRNTVTLHSLLRFVGTTLRSMNEPDRLLARLFGATAKIVSGADRRYKRNREGKPAVLPYLIWGIMMLHAEDGLCHGNFVVVFEQLCQDVHRVGDEAAAWFMRPANWQDAVRAVAYRHIDRPAALDRMREELRSALRARVLGAGFDDLQWLVPVASDAEHERATRAAVEPSA